MAFGLWSINNQKYKVHLYLTNYHWNWKDEIDICWNYLSLTELGWLKMPTLMHYAWASQWYNYYTTLLEKLRTFDQSISILSNLVGIYLLIWVVSHFNALLLFHFICDKRWILMLALQLHLLDCHPWTCSVNIVMFSWTTPFLALVPEMLSAPYGKFSADQLHINWWVCSCFPSNS